MLNFVLVHGSWHGAWCWRVLTPYLERAGYRVTAVSLPGRGDDPTPADQISLDHYINCVLDAATDADRRNVLVGHSMGGMTIAGATEMAPEKFAASIFVSAYLPCSGDTLMDLSARYGPNPKLLQTLSDPVEGGRFRLREGCAPDLFYHDCSQDDAQWASQRLCDEPLAPILTPVYLTEQGFGSVPRYYVECHRDKAVSLDAQRGMYRDAGCDGVISLDCGHSPFLSKPGELAACLIGALDAPAIRSRAA